MPSSLSVRVFTLVAAVLTLAPAFGQRGGPAAPPSSGGGTPAGGTTGGGRGTGSTPTPTINPNPTGNQTNPNPDSTRPLFISGMLMMDDGSELPHNIAMERVCGGIPRIEGYADGKGFFSLQLGSRSADALQDASTSGFDDFKGGAGSSSTPGGFSSQQMLNCELRARMPGYQSQSVDLTTRQAFDSPDVGTILLHRIAPTEGSTISATTLAAPKSAKKAFRKGLELEKKGKLDEARASFQQAADLFPKYAEAWFELGRIQKDQGQSDPARQSFDAAIHADASYVLPYIQISLLDLSAQRWQELADDSDKAVRLDSFRFPQAFLLNAIANYNLHRVEAAEKSARRAQKLDTQHRLPQVSRLLGLILEARKDYAAAAVEMRDYLKFDPHARDAAAVRSRLEFIEKQSAPAPQP